MDRSDRHCRGDDRIHPIAEPAALTTALLVPVKAFSQAKLRLAGVLLPSERAALARKMAETVVRAAGPLRAWVVSDDAEVADWARGLGAGVLSEPGRGLNGAVQHSVSQLASLGYLKIIVAHGDLPLASNLGWVADHSGITLVPDRRADGTNVVGIPAGSGFQFSYGPGSFARHVAEAERLGLPLRVVHHRELGWDVDVPDDLARACPRPEAPS
jgi:2-phospho-L-lactate guanylyltransferase